MEDTDWVRTAVDSIRATAVAATWVGLLLGTALDSGDSGPAAGDSGAAADDAGHLVLDAEHAVLEADDGARRLLSSRTVEAGVSLSSVLPEVEPLATDGGEKLAVDPDDSSRRLDVQWRPFSEAYGEASGVLVLEPAGEERDARGRYRELVENAYELCLILDGDGRITFAAPSIERILGFEPEAVVGTVVFEQLHPADRDDVEERFESLLEVPDGTRRFECRTQNREGEWRVFEGVAWNALENPDVEGVVVHAVDATERKRREHELERRADRLEEFAEVVSHDLRNPLQVARGNLDRAEATDDPEAFEHVRTAHDRMAAIVEDVLELARLGEPVQETEPIHLESVARDAWETTDTKEMTLTVGGDRQFEGDRQRVRQLLENLYRNAAEHAGPETDVFVGPIEPFHTSTRVQQQQRRGFYVSDDGPGIPEEDREAVFDSRFTTTEDGTGFGLAIVEEIADAHRWDVTVTGSNYGGARFEFTETPDDVHLRPG